MFQTRQVRFMCKSNCMLIRQVGRTQFLLIHSICQQYACISELGLRFLWTLQSSNLEKLSCQFDGQDAYAKWIVQKAQVLENRLWWMWYYLLHKTVIYTEKFLLNTWTTESSPIDDPVRPGGSISSTLGFAEKADREAERTFTTYHFSQTTKRKEH